jgi:hypothetical protein
MSSGPKTQDFSSRRPMASAASSTTGDQVQVNLSLATDVTCDNCGNYTFHEVVLMKHFSELTSPTGKAGNLPIPTFACNHCGFVNDGFIPAGYFANKPNPTKIDTTEALSKPKLVTE